jgi:hypothetical protein
MLEPLAQDHDRRLVHGGGDGGHGGVSHV